jgi:predicted ATPase
MSDGSMILLGYLAALLAEPRPNLILLEEPENGIHPYALEPLVAFFRDCLAQSEDLQILMSSHSPYLVDPLKAQEVILTRRNEEGFTEAACLDGLPDMEQWLENLSPGELWTMGGEDELIRRIRQRGGGDA